MEQQAESWRARLAQAVGRQVHEHRNRKRPKMSAQQLADECSRLGLRFPRGTIAKLESGDRAVISLDELLVLAAALRVPPVRLIAPIGFADEIEALPDKRWPSWDAAKWIIGDVALTADGQLGAPDPLEPMLLYRQHDELIAHRQRAHASGSVRGVDLMEMDAQILRFRAQMQRYGLLPPPLPADLVHLDEWTGQATDASQP